MCHVQNRQLHGGRRWAVGAGGGAAANRDVVSMRADEKLLEPDGGDGGTAMTGLNAPEF